MSTTETPWNWCPECEQDVQDDMRTGEYLDGSTGTCIGCGTVYVAVAFEDGSWALVPEDEGEPPVTDGEAAETVERLGIDVPAWAADIRRRVGEASS